MDNLRTYLFMKKDSKDNKLRDKAEEILSKNIKSEIYSSDDFPELVHELQTNQIELEMQNKQLRSSQVELEESKLKYFSLYEFAPVGYFSLNKQEIIKDVNVAGTVLLGIEKSKLINTAFIQYMNSESRRTFYKHLEKVKTTDTRQTCELELIKKDGTKIYAHLETITIKDDEEDFNEFRITATDITELNFAEEALKGSEEKYRSLYETMTQGVIHQDANGYIISANPAALRIMELNHNMMNSETYFNHHPDSIHEDGTDFPLETHPSMVALKTGKGIRNVIMGIKTPEKSYIWININATPLFKPGEKKPYQVYITFEDITETIKAKKLLNETLAELKRSNTELEQFAYVASHDLQEPLRMVASFTQLLEKQYKDKLDENAREYINYAVDGAKRMQGLINDLLAYSRVTTKADKFEDIYLEKVLDEVLFNMEIVIGENEAVITRESLPNICADYRQMVQVFQNIIGNALKYRGPKTPQIHISAQKENEHWLFSLEDNGIGIEPKYFEQIFEIFKRLHAEDEYEGTGIGLAITKRIVERHGGRIWVESEPDKGSAFYFTIPDKLL